MLTPLPGAIATKPGGHAAFSGVVPNSQHGWKAGAGWSGGFLVIKQPVARNVAHHLRRSERY